MRGDGVEPAAVAPGVPLPGRPAVMRKPTAAPPPSGQAQALPLAPDPADLAEQIIRSTVEGIVVHDRELRYVLWNPVMERITGMVAAEVLGKHPLEVFPQMRELGTVAQLQRALAGDSVAMPEHRSVDRSTGKELWLAFRLTPLRAPSGEVTGLVVAVSDVTERHEQHARILRLNRMHAVLAGITGLILRARDRQELFEGACRIAVDAGGFRLALIVAPDGDQVRPVASAGAAGGYVDRLRISLDPSCPSGQGPTARALRERRPCVCADIAADPAMAPWREAALAEGFRSTMCYPLLVGEVPVAALNLYAAEPGLFDDEEMKLLGDLAGDISYALQAIARQEQLDFLSYYDVLTGLANRTLFIDRLVQAAQEARREEKGMALLLVDLERFKAVNDALGTAAGDELLKAVAVRMVDFAGDAMQAGRIGGDRFGVMVPDLKHASDLLPFLQGRLWKSMSRPYRLAGQELRLSAKLGIALFPDDGGDAESLFRNAESALKKAKATGERYLFYSQEMSSAIKDRLNLESRLRRAIEHEEFVLHYEPKVDLRSGAICGAEALLRWNSPDAGMVLPMEFIALLEETGMIHEVGRWVLQQAAAERRRWIAAGLRAPPVSVNVSAQQLRQADFVDVIRATVDAPYGDAAGIELEITESVLMDRIQGHLEKLKLVRDMGVSIAIDDFGTGYSSLAYLARLPVAAVKIDRSFIVSMAESTDTAAIVSAIVSLAHGMNLRVVAEGVDAAEQLKLLRLLKCDEIQGYLFSPALPADDFVRLVREGRRLPR